MKYTPIFQGKKTAAKKNNNNNNYNKIHYDAAVYWQFANFEQKEEEEKGGE